MVIRQSAGPAEKAASVIGQTRAACPPIAIIGGSRNSAAQAPGIDSRRNARKMINSARSVQAPPTSRVFFDRNCPSGPPASKKVPQRSINPPSVREISPSTEMAIPLKENVPMRFRAKPTIPAATSKKKYKMATAAIVMMLVNMRLKCSACPACQAGAWIALAFERSWTGCPLLVVNFDASHGLGHPDYARTRRKGDEQLGFVDPPDLQFQWRQ